jgi:hypothetical protein
MNMVIADATPWSTKIAITLSPCPRKTPQPAGVGTSPLTSTSMSSLLPMPFNSSHSYMPRVMYQTMKKIKRIMAADSIVSMFIQPIVRITFLF